MRIAFLLLLSAWALLAQIGLPGQYPPGQYPPGQSPGRYPGNNGPGIPAPSRGSRKSTSDKAIAPEPRTFSGVIRKLDAKSFDLELEDTRFLLIQISSSTTKPDLKTGDGVDVVATEDKEGPFQAVSIKPNPEIARTINANDEIEPEVQERTGPPPTILVRPNAANDADDSGPPKLKRGKPPARASSQETQEDNAASLTPPEPRVELPPPIDARQAFILKAREVAATFLEGLPNYFCQEVTTRYVSETRVPSWNVVDVVSAAVVYEDGKESYRNVTINGKPSKKPPEESGAWSTGEFGTILAALFSPFTDGKFKYMEDATIAHQQASVYNFQVERLRSTWTIHVPSQYIVPAHKGSVWIDKQSAHTLRIEMQAKDVPAEFPLISAESAVDYDYVSLGTPEKFLLPVHAEVLSCVRGSNQCEKNVIDFRNYHKFSGESTIKFNDQ
jgi:hypothetical protein